MNTRQKLRYIHGILAEYKMHVLTHRRLSDEGAAKVVAGLQDAIAFLEQIEIAFIRKENTTPENGIYPQMVGMA
jgi:hypothetical protein